MPIARSDPRRATIIGIVGVVVGTVMIVLVLFAGNLGGGDDKTTPSKATFDVGPATDRAAAIARDRVPLFFADTATGSRPIVVNHLDADPNTGWVAFDAAPGGCALEWHVESQDFTDCKGTRYPANGTGLHQYPTKVDKDDVLVDLSLDATTTTSSSS